MEETGDAQGAASSLASTSSYESDTRGEGRSTLGEDDSSHDVQATAEQCIDIECVEGQEEEEALHGLTVDELAESGEQLFKTFQYGRAAQHLRHAADRGHVRASILLASLLRHGLGTKRNGEEALRRYREAAEAGDPLGKYYYAVYLNEGQNASDAMVEQDIPLARKLWKEANEPLEKAAEEGDWQAQFMMGVYYSFGFANEVDQDKAEHYYTLAAEQGHFIAIHNLGWRANHCERDREKAKRFYARAAAIGYPSAQTNLARLLEKDGDYDQALMWLRKACDAKYPRAMSDLGCIYYLGNMVERDDAKAFELFKAAADEGYPQAIHNMACMYQNGDGVERSNEMAVKYFQAAAERGNSGSHFNLGYLQLRGAGTEQNEELALSNFRKGAEGTARLKVRLANAMRSGLFSQPPEAFRDECLDLYQRAAEEGSAEACIVLGITVETAAIDKCPESWRPKWEMLHEGVESEVQGREKLQLSGEVLLDAPKFMGEDHPPCALFSLAFHYYTSGVAHVHEGKDTDAAAPVMASWASHRLDAMHRVCTAQWRPLTCTLFPIRFVRVIETLMVLALVDQRRQPRFPSCMLWTLPSELLMELCEHFIVASRAIAFDELELQKDDQPSDAGRGDG